MSTDPLTECPPPGARRPGAGHDDAILLAQARIAVERWLLETPGAAEAIEEAVRAHVRVLELASRARAAQQAREAAEQRHATLLTRYGPEARPLPGFGTALRLARSSAAARRAWETETAAWDAHAQAVRRLQRHLGEIRQLLRPWALCSAAPAKVDRAAWAAALEQAVSRLFPAP
jgi:hypothetical protein